MTEDEKRVDQHVLDLLQRSGLKPDEVASTAIIWKSFYKEVKPSLKNMSGDDLVAFAGKFILFVIQFEIICARAFKPLSGTQSVAREIISMYSSRELNFATTKSSGRKKLNALKRK